MDRIVTLSVCVLLIFTIVPAVGSAAAPSDIISGREFLSILMKPTGHGTAPVSTQQPSRSFRGLRKFRHFFYDKPEDDDDDSILPIEALFTTSQEDMDLSSTRFYGNRNRNRAVASSQGTTAIPTPEATVVNAGSTEGTVAPPTTSMPTTAYPGGEGETSPTTDLPPEDATSADPTEDSVTTTVEVVEEQTFPTEPVPAVVRGVGGGRTPKRAKVVEGRDEQDQGVVPPRHSNAHRSELSVEELDPTISKEEHQDQAARRGEPSQQQQRTHRTQRKQDSKGPFQSVAYQEARKLDTRKPTPMAYGLLGAQEQERSPKAPWRDLGEPMPTGGGLRADSSAPPQVYSEPARFYSEPAQFYSEPARVYSEPAKVYGEPERVYSQPARVYSEPARVYSEPAKIYSEPARIYSEPAKVYSQPSSYWQTAYSAADPTMTTTTTSTTTTATTTTTTIMTSSTLVPETEQPASTSATPPLGIESGSVQQQRQRLVFNELDKIPYDQLNAPTAGDGDAGSLHSAIGKFVPKQSHVPGTSQETPEAGGTPSLAGPVLGDDAKVGYVVEGRNYRKYRVEEKTPDGFIVGEYGVLSHNDGNLRGVRYTADSDINPRLIYDALLKFLSL